MKELHNHIFSATTCISKETMMKYIKHQLSKKELHEVEKHMLDCDLCSDAMAGMKFATNSATILAIDNKIDNRIATGESNPFFRGGWLMAAASLVAIIFGVYFLFNLFDENKFAQNEMAVHQQTGAEQSNAAPTENYIKEERIDEDKKDVVDRSQNKDEATEDNTLKMAETATENLEQPTPPSVFDKPGYRGTPNKDRIEDDIVLADEAPESMDAEVVEEEVFSKNDNNATYYDNEVLNNNQQVISSTVAAEESEPDADKVVVEKQRNETNRKKAKSAQAPTAKQEAVASGNSLSAGITAQNTYYLYDYKVVDYTVEYQNEEDFKKLAETDATPVDFLNKEQKAEAEKSLDQTIVKETYKDVLERAIINFKKLAYKEALIDFEMILAKHPKDVNALFYGALSEYNLKNYKRALSKLDAVLKNPQTEFNQEAKWNKVLVLIEVKETVKAKKLLQEIIDEKGFYQQRAQDKLKTLN
ncbi:MAG: hypothetical protein OQJ96_00125 [Flavobacteriales bacterium]|nr:hypothetical protein [Flavobacteriales bacterium]MCW8912163.1 hypothetical protein [Flavobacteriales bacterium]MCW8938028.1 hypothetical protein [Flavobacteriales bacterium]MCW8940059.1 hypothetical protein [Flavobacteriales bacterium]MCW8967253.1 hypothetical protein [Flavobacteriales bacterium]